MPLTETRVPIEDEEDIVTARQKGRQLAAARGLSLTEQTLIATAISEVARNIVVYAHRGEVVLSAVEEQGRRGVMVVARDEGPGIPNPTLAMRDGFSTGNSLGMGLPGAKRLMDEFELSSTVGKGTTVTMKKWVR
ncbi:MAG TPA: anti-sigma regulatory factor [Anaeromyxobacteraceae bacterium]|nr:anti-sigma regulatory factor [Anaeromyxobacteraceae bacterium]